MEDTQNTPVTPATNGLTPEQLEIQELRRQLKASQAENAEKDDLIAEQVEQLDLAEAQKGKTLPVVNLEKKKYQLLASKFQVGGHEYQAEDLIENKSLLKKLLEAKSGLLIEVK